MQIDGRQVLLSCQSLLFQGKMTMTCFHKGFHFIEPRQCVLSHSHPTCSHSPLHCLLKAGKPFPTLPPHSLWAQWAFLIQAKNSYLGNSIQLPSLYFTPISLQILPMDIWVWPVNIFSSPFSPFSVCHNISPPFVCRRPYLGQEIIDCGVRRIPPSSMLSIMHSPTCLSLSH